MRLKIRQLLIVTLVSVLFLITGSEATLFAQRSKQVPEREGNEKLAKELFAMRNFREALEEYLLLYKKDTLNLTYNYRVGICYLNVNTDRSKCLPFLEYAIEQPKTELDAWYELGRAYLYNYRFDDAINAFKTYQKLQKGKSDKFTVPASRQIEMCRNAAELYKSPLNVSFHNLGEQINSAFPDFSPYIPSDESYIVFTSKRDNNIGRLPDFDGFFTSDIYTSSNRDGVWGKAKSIGTFINSDLVEEVAGLSADGNIIFAYIDNYIGFNDIIWAIRKGKSFQKGSPISPIINTNELETSATISPDKETIIFAAEREDRFGGTDLYITRKLPTGEWSAAKNMGRLINSDYNDEFPNFSPDGKILYFASQGHNSMGGYDIFKTTWDEDNSTWTKPVNVGYPINTPEDNMSISFTANGRYAYMAAFRPEGLGDLDIYKVIFHDVEPPYTIYKGHLLNKDSNTVFSSSWPLDSNITAPYSQPEKIDINNTDPQFKVKVTEKSSGRLVGYYRPNKISGRVTIILPPGEYALCFAGKGFRKYTEDITINDAGFYNTEINRNIVMLPADTPDKLEEEQ